VAKEVNGKTTTTFNDVEIDLAKENWQRLTMVQAIIKCWWPGMARDPVLADFASAESLAAFLRANAWLGSAPPQTMSESRTGHIF